MHRFSPLRAPSIRTAFASVVVLAACGDATSTLPVASEPSPVRATAALERAGRERIPFAPGEVLVRYKPGRDADGVAAKHKAKRARKLALPRGEVLEVPVGEEQAVLAALASDADVEHAELNEAIILAPCEVGMCAEATDAFNAAYKWDLSNTGTITRFPVVAGSPTQASGVADADMDWLEMYDALGANFAGSATIGILDSGILPTHNEVQGRIVAARNFAVSYPADLITDRDGHGTHVATIAAGRANGIGSTGIAYSANIKLINAKICERYNFGTAAVPDIRTACFTEAQVNAIYWAVDQGANVLNMSIGGSPLATSGSPLVEAALNYAVSKNVLPVCAAGNDNYANTSFPARFGACMAVAASNWNDQRASYSNYGGDVEVAAPGGDGNPTGSAVSLIMAAGITSNTGYSWKAGTSMAAPQVAGIAAMMYASGITDMAEVRARLKSTADPMPGVAGMGAGRVNAYRAVTGKDPYAPPVAVAQPVSGVLEGTPAAFTSAGSLDPNNHPIRFDWSFGDGTSSTEANPSHVYADNGEYTVTLTVTDESNRATTKTVTATIANAAPVVAAAPGTVDLLSGASITRGGSFADLGAADGPWAVAFDWGNGVTTASVATAGAIDATRRYCAVGTYPVRLTVTDKDGGAGRAELVSVQVSPNAVAVQMPGAFNRKANGSFPVTIFGRAGMPGTAIDVASVQVGDGVGAGARVSVKNNGSFHAGIEDVNGDGIADLVVHVARASLTAATTAETATLVVHAVLTDGCTAITGSQIVK